MENCDKFQNLAFTDQEFSKVEALLPQGNPEEKSKRIFNHRYEKIKKIGEGSFNTVYIAHDLHPDGQSRLLGQEVLEMIEKLPKSNTNPYKQKM